MCVANIKQQCTQKLLMNTLVKNKNLSIMSIMQEKHENLDMIRSVQMIFNLSFEHLQHLNR
jgi:hypothetical protein